MNAPISTQQTIPEMDKGAPKMKLAEPISSQQNIAEYHLMKAAQEFQKCMQCGKCRSVCPVFKEFGNEFFIIPLLNPLPNCPSVRGYLKCPTGNGFRNQ